MTVVVLNVVGMPEMIIHHPLLLHKGRPAKPWVNYRITFGLSTVVRMAVVKYSVFLASNIAPFSNPFPNHISRQIAIKHNAAGNSFHPEAANHFLWIEVWLGRTEGRS
jgi:hypothetical protein